MKYVYDFLKAVQGKSIRTIKGVDDFFCVDNIRLSLENSGYIKAVFEIEPHNSCYAYREFIFAIED